VALSNVEFDYIRKLLREHAALVLEPGKEYLVESRLDPLARREGFPSLQHLVEALRADQGGALRLRAVEAMTINETSFFRDARAFEVLKTVVMPDLVAKRASERCLNIWCAACSSGQEAYSIALMIREYFAGLQGWKTCLIASDLSPGILARAREGRYSQLEVNRGLPASLLVKYFHKRGQDWQINADLRRMVQFLDINLAEAWPVLPILDLIFMRNVLIYFDIEMKKTILAKIRRLLRSDGYLFLGGSETTLSLDSFFEPVPIGGTACYQFRESERKRGTAC
jgi:chemotaxis protein methyltransferase CheR